MKKRLKRLRNDLENVLSDLKARDFMQSPKIQELMAKVTTKGLNVVPIISRNLKKTKSGGGKKKPLSESAFRGKLKALENQINPQVARNLVSTIMKRADEIKKSYWDAKPQAQAAEPSTGRTTKRRAVKAKAGAKSKPAKKVKRK
ncbi:MAG: hypothetical protein ABL958_16835 [Bdellovibrionia bacterium]